MTDFPLLVRPRLTDHYDISINQATIDFAIPFLDEDIPLYVDPFLLWRSPSQQDQALHTLIVNSFNYLNYLLKRNQQSEAINILILMSECNEVGLGQSQTRKGRRMSENMAISILSLFKDIPEYSHHGFVHFEEIQLFISRLAQDRISDIACNFLKSFLIDFTIQCCDEFKIPKKPVTIEHIYNYQQNKILVSQNFHLPVNPNNNDPILLVPTRWLRFSPWINFDNYFRDYLPANFPDNQQNRDKSSKVLRFNRENYGVVQQYIQSKERTQQDCHNDPLFSQIPVNSAKKKLSRIKKLPSGNINNADRDYEKLVCQLLASMFYPQLDFAADQSRTESGTLIRDLIFYNNRNVDFLEEIYRDYGSRQLIFELKNVQTIERDHINQLNRYLNNNFGSFGIIVTRNPLTKAMYKNTIDLWSGQRRCILALTDEDISIMVDVFESKQRSPFEVLKKIYIEFRRKCPG